MPLRNHNSGTALELSVTDYQGGGGGSESSFTGSKPLSPASAVVRIGVGRFRILGGEQDLEYWGWGARGGDKFPAGT